MTIYFGLAVFVTFKYLYTFGTQQYTANSKKVVLRESKTQITKYKKKVCHITHMSERLTSSL